MNNSSKKYVSIPTGKEASEASLRKKKKSRKRRRVFFRAAMVFVFVAAVALMIFSLLFPVLMISGDSMRPGLNDGDLILLERTHNLDSGDLVCFRWNGKTLLKRVIACPGDWIIIDETGRVYRNGSLLDEPYVLEFGLGENDISYPFQVPDDSYFVMGDERKTSLDSRNTRVGCIRYDQILGKGVLRIWPWH